MALPKEDDNEEEETNSRKFFTGILQVFMLIKCDVENRLNF